MGKRPLLRPSYGSTSADVRPRVHLRIVDRAGVAMIGYRTHPTAIEKTEKDIEHALAACLGDKVTEPAVIMWEGMAGAETADA